MNCPSTRSYPPPPCLKIPHLASKSSNPNSKVPKSLSNSLMAQRDKKEETEIQFTETLTLTLCINNCGLYGNPTTNNMCQSCFRSKIRPSSPTDSGSDGPNSKLRSDPIRPVESDSGSSSVANERIPTGEVVRPQARVAVSRCLRCRKRVGLTGFRCRCGDLFCGDHRYSDRHDCGIDYKKDGRERIQRENPLVRAAKIVRI